jgi:hypothetical protein
MSKYILIEAVYMSDALSSDVLINLDNVCAVIKGKVNQYPALIIDTGTHVRPVGFASVESRDDHFEWMKELTQAIRKPMIMKIAHQ